MGQIPAPHPDDEEDISWALSTAAALWARGEGAESLKWLRRAAESASDANRDERAVELFKAAADMANDVERSKSQMPPPVTPSMPPTAPNRPTGPPQRPSMPPERPSALPERTSVAPEKASAVDLDRSSVPPSRRPPPPLPHAGGRGPERKAPVIVPPIIATTSPVLRTKRVSEIARSELKTTTKLVDAESDRLVAASTGDEQATRRLHVPPHLPPVALPKRGRTASRTKGLMSLQAQGRTETRRGDQTPPPGSMRVAPPAAETVRGRREDEVTAIRAGFEARPLGLKPPPTSAESFASSFDDEKTNVLSGEESFGDLSTTRQDQRSPAVDTVKEPAPQSVRNGAAAVASVTAFRVAIVADGSSVQILPLKAGESAGPGVPTAFIVPNDAISSDAIAQLLGRGGDK